MKEIMNSLSSMEKTCTSLIIKEKEKELSWSIKSIKMERKKIKQVVRLIRIRRKVKLKMMKRLQGRPHLLVVILKLRKKKKIYGDFWQIKKTHMIGE